MHKVLKMVLEKDKIDEDVVERLTSWTYSRYNVYLGEVIFPGRYLFMRAGSPVSGEVLHIAGDES